MDYIEDFNHIKEHNRNNNQYNQAQYETRKEPDFRRGQDKITISDTMRFTDWASEAKFYNHYRVNGKYSPGRMIKSKKK